MTTEKTLKAILKQFEDLKKQLNLRSDSKDFEDPLNNKNQNTKTTESRFLKFNDKEILKMPKTFRKEFRTQGCTAHVRKRIDGRYKCSYEIRYTRNGYNISASATTLEEAKKNFIKKLNFIETKTENQNTTFNIPKKFDEFALYWFENFHKTKVKEITFKINFALYHRHIEQKFKNKDIKSITAIELKNFLKSLPGNGKTEDDVHSILNQIFNSAIKHGLLKLNPLDFFFHNQHERQNGTELSREEETKLLTESKTEYTIIYAIMLYTGIRPNEYATAHIKDNFIIVNNSKQKKGKHIEKKIPICSHLSPYIENCNTLPKRNLQHIRNNFKKVLPNHTLKDLRKTFSTRCVNCHVDDYARKKFMGHSVGSLDKPYVGDIDNYLLTESKKLENWYSVPQNVPQK